ncbi:MAG TPA: ATP synthase subunit I [Actinomycetota bacterium]|nr:ATP synthase subunit I [Actinomycetota bacterium]
MAETADRPERVMVRRALVPSALAVAVAALVGLAASGPDAAASAAIGVAIVSLNFAAHGLSLAWASGVSIAAVHAVALGGFVVRLGVIVAAMFALNTMTWFSPLAFGLAVVPATLLLLVYEARLAIRGLGATLQIPADPAAVRAAETLAAREA